MFRRSENRDYGKIIDYDPQWKGPLAIERKKTDFGFLIALCVYLAVWICIGIYAFITVDPEVIRENFSNGKKLGRDDENVVSIGERIELSFSTKVMFIAFGFIGLGIFLSYMFLLLLRYHSRAVFYTSCAINLIILFILIYTMARVLAEHHRHEDLNVAFAVTLFVSVVTFIIVIVLFVYFRKKIFIACGVVEESAKAVMFFPSVFLFPILPLILYGMWITFAALIFVCLLGNPSTRSDNNAHLIVFHIINIFGLFWIVNFIRAFSQMVLSGTFATWYWAMDKDRVPSSALLQFIGLTTRFHLGTLAFGSLIIAIAEMIRALMQAASERARSNNDAVGVIIYTACKWMCMCAEGMIEYINSNAYVMCSIHGTKFYQSGKDAFNLLWRNFMTVLSVLHVTGGILFMGILIVVGLSLLATYIFCRDMHDSAKYAALLVVGISTLIIAALVLGILERAINTIFLCVLEDYERNDGSSGRPYFMSDKLKELLIQHP